MQQRTQAIMTGLILGDGYLTKPDRTPGKSMLDIKYNEKYLSYLKWIHKEIKELNPSPIRQKKNYNQYRFYTKANKEVGKLRELFYPNGIKIIPKYIAKYLKNSLTIAVWYQDDGTLDFRSGYHANSLFATHCFSRDECQLLADALQKNFKLDVRVCRCLMRGKLYFRLYVVSKSMEKFMQIIEPHMQKCFNYKILKYRLRSQQQR
jgi:hypothetical protein